MLASDAEGSQFLQDVIGGVVADSREHQRVLVPDRPFDSYAAYALEFMQALGDSRHRGRLTENLERDHRRETMTQPGDGPNVSVKLAPDAIRGAVRALDALESSRPSGAEPSCSLHRVEAAVRLSGIANQFHLHVYARAHDGRTLPGGG